MRFRLLELGPRRSRHESPGRASAAAAARFEFASCSRSTISIRVAEAPDLERGFHAPCLRLPAWAMDSSLRLIFSVDPID